MDAHREELPDRHLYDDAAAERRRPVVDTRLVGMRQAGRSAAGESELLGHLRTQLDRSPLATALVDAATGTLRYANPAFLRLDGIRAGIAGDIPVNGDRGAAGEAASARGRDIASLMPRAAASALGELFGQVQLTGAARRDIEVSFDRAGADGTSVVWSVTVWPTSERGGQQPGELMLQVLDASEDVRDRQVGSAAVGELREINQRLLIASLREEELKERAQAADAAKSAFLATMSHELRTPLAAIIGYEELLSDGITGPVTSAQRQQLARIKGSAVHLLALIDEVLTFARVEAKGEIVNWQTVELAADVVEVVASLIQPLAASKGLAFDVRLPDGPVTIRTDVLKVRQILVNLIGNSVKYSDAGSITLAVREQGDLVVFEVRDTGIGIAPENLERIFDAFWQVSQTSTRTVGGTGIGLSVARRLARRLGGEVTVASVVGKGSSFTLWLPRQPVGVAASPEDEPAGGS